ncbi:hypothetical protein PR048_017864 [Dryococelus australis]|uniref:Uncharacterized protein n=1 Tax=Dryococelus australis TaxID=614101 RepID=A0ABQ9HAN3_9NEOP|nr:hypothetical protein PR048_017864 [Dryococelus australis]
MKRNLLQGEKRRVRREPAERGVVKAPPGEGAGEAGDPRESPPAVSSDTIPTCDHSGVARPEFEPGSSWKEASWLTAQAHRTPFKTVPLLGNKLSPKKGEVFRERLDVLGSWKSGTGLMSDGVTNHACFGPLTTRFPTRRTGFDSEQGRSRIFACGNRARRCRLSASDLPFTPHLYIPALFHTHLVSLSSALKTCVKIILNLPTMID